MNDASESESGDGEGQDVEYSGNFGLPSLGYVVGDGQGAIESGEAGDILIGDSINIEQILGLIGGSEFSQSESEFPFQNDQINGNGGDDLIIGDSLNTTMLNESVFQSIYNYASGDEGEYQGELPPNLAELNLGWYAFTLLEIFDDDWDRNDTIEFILDPENRESLVEEASNLKGFEGVGGNDMLLGGDGDDEVYGQGGNDIILGDSGHDELYGGQGNDIVLGGNGADTLDGGKGDDILVGDNAVVHSGAVLLVEDHDIGIDGTDTVVGGEGVDTAGEAGGPEETYIDVVENGPTNDINGADGIEDLVPVLPVV